MAVLYRLLNKRAQVRMGIREQCVKCPYGSCIIGLLQTLPVVVISNGCKMQWYIPGLLSLVLTSTGM